MWVLASAWVILICLYEVHGKSKLMTNEQLLGIANIVQQNLQKALLSDRGADESNCQTVLATLLFSFSPAGGFQVAGLGAGRPVPIDFAGLAQRNPMMIVKPIGKLAVKVGHFARNPKRPIAKSVETVKDLVDDDDWHTSAFKKETIAALTGEVQRQIYVPGVPSPILNWLLTQIVEAMANNMSLETQVELRAMLATGFTTGANVKATRENINALSDKISVEIAPKIAVPVLSLEAEKAAIAKIVNVLLTRKSFSAKQRRKQKVKFLIKGGKTVLDEKGREELVAELNEKVDIPFLDEAAEQKLLMGAVTTTARIIEEIVPPSLLQCLDGHQDAQGYSEMRASMIERIEKEGFGLVPKEAITWVVTNVVDTLLKSSVGNMEADMALLTSEERIAKLKDRRFLCVENMHVNELRHQQEQDNLMKRIAKIDELLEMESHGTMSDAPVES